ncbi:hypothetical protein WICPIJ_000399 [Wickerhamomyces pijperi]|uniref:CBM21 domain-containing protein n=1 Tax=Wickerhamomyces pijperi TaxID=599730 RepID=A0A9P8TSM4_WICPI|nr:hypothetical protein WICPIJ_000399 [Wickerhamomyces pijperi]
MVFVSPSTAIQTTILSHHKPHLSDIDSIHHNNVLPFTSPQTSLVDPKEHDNQDENTNPTVSLSETTTTIPTKLKTKESSDSLVHRRRNSNIVLDETQPQAEVFSLSFLTKRRPSSGSEENVRSLKEEANNKKPPPLVRKKSGELVKSSLKLNSLLGSGSKSMPATPCSYNKSVHFGQNVDVRYFNERDRPTAVSANTSPLLKPSSNGSSKASFDIHGFKRHLNRINHNSNFDDDDDKAYDSLEDDFELSANSDSDCEQGEDGYEDYEDSWEFKFINFEKTKYNEQFNKKAKVFLEKILIDGQGTSELIGFVAVKNLAYEKRVHLRYTLDNWKTIIEIEASFNNESIPRVLKRAGYDRFQFKIDLNRLRYLIKNKEDISLQFALRFNYDQEEVWDNNMDKNYALMLSRKTYKTFHRSNKTLTINDYFDDARLSGSFPSSSSSPSMDSGGIRFEEINDYFNNYQSTLRSPDTPFSLKANGSKAVVGDDDVSQLNFTDVAFEPYRESTPTTTTTSISRNHNYTTKKPEASSSKFMFSSQPSDSLNKSKPSINSKSYQELLETYCFYKSPNNSPMNSSGNALISSAPAVDNDISTPTPTNPSTISTFLTSSVNN